MREKKSKRAERVSLSDDATQLEESENPTGDTGQRMYQQPPVAYTPINGTIS